MVQVLPYVPSFGEKLAGSLDAAGTNLAEGYRKNLEFKQSQKAMGVLQDPSKTPMQKVSAFMTLPEGLKKSSAPIWAAVLGPAAQAESSLGMLDTIRNRVGNQGAQPGMQQQPQMNAESPMQQINQLAEQQGMTGPQQPRFQMPPQQQMQQPGQAQPQPPQAMQPQTQMNQPQPMQGPQVDPNNIETWPDKELANLMLAPGEIGELGKKEYARRQAVQKEQRKEQEKLRDEARAEERKIEAEERQIEQKVYTGYLETVENDRLKLPQEELANEMITDAVINGDVDPFSSSHMSEILQQFGAPESLLRAMETPGSKEFKTGLKTFLGSTIKEAFRGTTSTIEIKLVEDMLAQVGATREANLAASWGLQVGTQIKRERLRLTDEAREQGISPGKVPAYVEKKMIPFRSELKDEYFEALKTLKERGKNAKK